MLRSRRPELSLVAVAAAAAGTLLTVSAASATTTPTPTPSASPTASATPTPSASPAVSATPTATISPSASAASTPSPSPSPSPSARPVTGYGPGTLTALTLPVTDTGRTSRQVWVWLPPGVQDSPLLPVVYLLPGQYETPRTPFQLGIADVLSRQFANGMQPFELVVPDGVSATHSDPEWADAWDGSDRLETFLAQQVIPAVEGSTPRPRSLRAISGFSMGGYGAAVDAARKNTLFGQFVGMAGYYHLDDPQGVLGPNPTYQYVHTPLARADQYDATRVLLLDNTQDQSSPTFAGDVYRMRDALANAGHRPGALVTSGTHSWAWVNSVLPFAVRFLSQGWGR